MSKKVLPFFQPQEIMQAAAELFYIILRAAEPFYWNWVS
jgi:hypothetical protein